MEYREDKQEKSGNYREYPDPLTLDEHQQTLDDQAAVWSSTTITTSLIAAVGGTEAFTGFIDEVAIFSTGLSERDIKLICAKGLEEAINPTAVKAMDKLAITWADAKVQAAK